MRLQAGPGENESGYERKKDAAHQAQHPGGPIGAPKVDHRSAAQTRICHVLAVSAGGIIPQVGHQARVGSGRSFTSSSRASRPTFLAYCLHVTLARRLHALAPGLTPRSVLEKKASPATSHSPRAGPAEGQVRGTTRRPAATKRATAYGTATLVGFYVRIARTASGNRNSK